MGIPDQLAALPSVLALSAAGVELDRTSIVVTYLTENASYDVRGCFMRTSDGRPFPWSLRFAREQVHANGLSDPHIDWLQPTAGQVLAAIAPPPEGA